MIKNKTRNRRRNEKDQNININKILTTADKVVAKTESQPNLKMKKKSVYYTNNIQ